MSFSAGRSLFSCAAIALALASCATPPRVDGSPSRAEREALYSEHLDAVSAAQGWTLVARIAVSSGKDGGSGRLDWQSGPESDSLQFHGTLGRGAWRLHADADGAVLELANGDVFQAADVSALIRDYSDWPIPVESLRWWVRGLAVPDVEGSKLLDENGRMATLSQQQWRIEYKRYEDFDGIVLPVRLEARQDDLIVKFAMRDWDLAPAQSDGA